MNPNREASRCFIEQTRRSLPASAYPRRTLLEFLQMRGAFSKGALRLKVIDVFNAGERAGPMCRFIVGGERAPGSFVAPIG